MTGGGSRDLRWMQGAYDDCRMAFELASNGGLVLNRQGATPASFREAFPAQRAALKTTVTPTPLPSSSLGAAAVRSSPFLAGEGHDSLSEESDTPAEQRPLEPEVLG